MDKVLATSGQPTDKLKKYGDNNSLTVEELDPLSLLLSGIPLSRPRYNDKEWEDSDLLAMMQEERTPVPSGEDYLEDIPFEERKEVNLDNAVTYGEDEITGSYYNDLSLPTIDGIICKRLIKEMEKVGKKERKLVELRKISAKNRHDLNIKKRAVKMETEISNIKNGNKLRIYQTRARPFLTEYVKLGKANEEQEFGQTDIVSKPDDYRLGIILRYIEVARSYIKVNLISVQKDNSNCIFCQAEWTDSDLTPSGSLICPGCNRETMPLQHDVSQSDLSGGSKGYLDLETFDKAVDCYEGRQRVTFPDNLISDLDEYFHANNYPVGEDVRKMELHGEIKGRRRRGRTSRDIMKKSLKATGHTDHYKDAYLLCRYYWGWEQPDLSMVRDILRYQYKIIQEIFNKKKGTRKSSLGADYRLFRQCWHINVPCHPCDFNIVCTDKIVIFYEKIWSEICDEVGKKLGWRPFVSIYALYLMDPDTLEPPDTL